MCVCTRIYMYLVFDSATSRDYSPPCSSIHGISRQEYCSELSFPSLTDLPNPGIEPLSPALAGGFFITEPSGKPILFTSFQVYYQFSSVTQLCLTLCDPMNCSTPGLPVHHQLLESTQTHVHRVGDAIQSSLPPSSPSPPAFYLSQHQGLFQ